MNEDEVRLCISSVAVVDIWSSKRKGDLSLRKATSDRKLNVWLMCIHLASVCNVDSRELFK